ncbi:hypothetical protein [Herbaspirillum sp. CAH-3]|uniref:hypothetical protein n=1 Tax=Herbaspirillum sp. CAH-3 TaxID=2605746 RepID=UPI0012ACBB4A|nr:hypothetical protein [Herbaspirillum sp. CAH-3]MRT30777.1 hypothetical protein [Herbaspirillum sp. CAH-3]
MSAIKLEPCPFCGEHLKEISDGYFQHSVNSCFFEAWEYDFGGSPSMVLDWNRRAKPAEEVQSAPDELRAIFRKAVFDQGFAIINRLMKAFTQSEELRPDGDVKAVIHEAMNMAGELTRAARACGYEPPLQTGCSYETWPGCDTQKRPYALPWKKVQPEEVSILNPKAEEGGAP